MDTKKFLLALNELDDRTILKAQRYGTARARWRERLHCFSAWAVPAAACICMAAVAVVLFCIGQLSAPIDGAPGSGLESGPESSMTLQAARESWYTDDPATWVTVDNTGVLLYQDQLLYQPVHDAFQDDRFISLASGRDVMTLTLPKVLYIQKNDQENTRKYLCALYAIDFCFKEENGQKTVDIFNGYSGLAGISYQGESANYWYADPDGMEPLPGYLKTSSGAMAMTAEEALAASAEWTDAASSLAKDLLAFYLEQNRMTGWSLFDERTGETDLIGPRQTRLTLNRLLALTEKDTGLTWDDLKDYEYKDEGSGRYIMVFPVEGSRVCNYEFTVNTGSLEQLEQAVLSAQPDGPQFDVLGGNLRTFLKIMGEITEPVPAEELPSLSFPTAEEYAAWDANYQQGDFSSVLEHNEDFYPVELSSMELTDSMIAHIWGQDQLSWEGLDPSETFAAAGNAVYYGDRGQSALVTLGFLAKGKADYNPTAVTIYLHSGETAGRSSGNYPQRSNDFYGTEVTTHIWPQTLSLQDYEKYYPGQSYPEEELIFTDYAANFIRGRGDHAVSVEIHIHMGWEDGTEPLSFTAEELMARIVSQCLRPENTCSIDHLLPANIASSVYSGSPETDLSQKAKPELVQAALDVGDLVVRDWMKEAEYHPNMGGRLAECTFENVKIIDVAEDMNAFLMGIRLVFKPEQPEGNGWWLAGNTKDLGGGVFSCSRFVIARRDGDQWVVDNIATDGMGLPEPSIKVNWNIDSPADS